MIKPERENDLKYSKEFKEEALKLSDEIGLKKAAQQLGIQYYTLSDWRAKQMIFSRTHSVFSQKIGRSKDK